MKRWICLVLLACGCGRVEQAPECASFVACVRANDVLSGTSTNLVRFEPDGTCWSNEEQAQGCRPACQRGLAFLATIPASAPECRP